MKNILFPTDYSEAANNAFIYALKFAQKMNAKITTLHVNQMPVLEIERSAYAPDIEKLQESLELESFGTYKDGLVQLKSIAKKAGLSNIPMQHVMESGKVIQTIIKVADENDTDLIIMGTKGAGWLKEIFFGSNTAEILENANCPVLAIPKDATFDGKIDKIAVTTEFAKREEKVIQRVLEFATAFDATVYVVNVDITHTHLYTQNMDKLKTMFEAYGDKINFIVLNGNDLIEDLSWYLEINSFDFVVMHTHKRNFIQELFNFSKAKAMSYHHKIPVLSIPDHIL